MTQQHLSVRGNDHIGFDRVLSLQMALNTADNCSMLQINRSKQLRVSYKTIFFA